MRSERDRFVGQPLRPLLARDQGPDDLASGHAEDVAGHRAELDVGILQHLRDPVVHPVELARQFDPVARQVAQFLNRPRRHETGLQQPVRQQIGDPLGVVLIRLPAGMLCM